MEDTTAVLVNSAGGVPWLLAPFIDPMVEKEKARFFHELAKVLGITRRALELRIDDLAERRRLLEYHRKDLRQAYRILGRDLNLTSLALLSTPATDTPSSGEAWLCGETKCIRGRWEDATPARVGWLGTGDADLKEDTRRRAFLEHYQRHLLKVHTLVLPHHGAESNFDVGIVRATAPLLCTVAADEVGTWRHPASRVVQSVASEGVDLRPVTSGTPSAITEHFDVRWS